MTNETKTTAQLRAEERVRDAAPDLLAACKALANRFDSRVSDSSKYPELAAARAAIAKATKGGGE